jgi:hypothetical protein
MKNLKKLLCMILTSLTILSSATVFTGCGTTSDDPQGKETLSADTNEESDTGEVDNRFAGVNYQGREFRIYTSNHGWGAMQTSNTLIEGPEEMGSGLVNDAVFTRNLTVEDQLGVDLVFYQCELSWGSIAPDIRKYTQSGDDEFDLVINDIYDYAELVIEGHFRNTLDPDCVFDFDRNYWYKEYMEDLRLMDGYQHFLAGDFFIDVLRCGQLLLVNKDLYRDYYRASADELYDVVANYEWTYDRLTTIITDLYIDRDLDGAKTPGDQFGFAHNGYWGAVVPLVCSGTTNFITRDESGVPTITIHEGDRANQITTAMTKLLNNENTSLDHGGGPLKVFVGGNALVAGGVSLGSLESTDLRAMESDAAVLPNPMLFSSDKKYTTSTSDITEMGAILTTSKDMAFISTVVEVLNRETARILIPKYYKESLQVQCVDDEKAAHMIDIIHDNFGNAFILAYNHALNGQVLQAFSKAVENKREFSAVYVGSSKGVNKILGKKIQTYISRNNIA